MKKRILCLVLALLMVFGLVSAVLPMAFADTEIVSEEVTEENDVDLDIEIVLPAYVIYEVAGTSAVPVYMDYTAANQIGTLKKAGNVEIAQVGLVGDVEWIQLAEGGWVKLGKVSELPLILAPGITVSVTNDYVNVRKGPSAGTAQLGQAKRGEQLVIYLLNSNATWGYCAKGWICLMYTNFADRIAEDEETGNVVATGTVTCSSALNVRKEPGAGSAQVGTVANGTKVQIYEIVTVSGHKWGRISYGWICMDYVTIDSTGSGTVAPSETTKPEESKPEESKPETKPEENKPQDSGFTPGIVANSDTVNVRSNAGLAYPVVTKLARNTAVKVYEQKQVSTAFWGRIDQGWICMDYVELNKTAPTTPAETGTSGEWKGYVSSSVKLNIRAAADGNSAKVGALDPKTEVTITQKKVVQGVTWGKISEGWINLNYVVITHTNGVKGVEGTIANCSSYVNIRSAAGVSNALVGKANLGSRVFVTETTKVNGVAWGKIANGWVCMDYVKLDSAFETEVKPEETKPEETKPEETKPEETTPADYKAAVIANTDMVNVRSGAGLGYPIATRLARNTAVKVYEQVKVNTAYWAKIDQGWVCMDYVQLNDGSAPSTPSTPAEPVNPNNTMEEPGVITCSTTVNIRSAAGVGNPVVKTLPNGTKVTIYEKTTVNNVEWGRINKTVPQNGVNEWVCLQYVKLNNAGTTGNTGNTGSSNTGSTGTTGGSSTIEILTVVPQNAIAVAFANEDVHVRAGTGLGYNVIGTVKKGENIVIYEKTIAGGMSWARTDKGWVCLTYFTVTGIGTNPNATVARCFFTSNVRTSASYNGALQAKVMVSSRIAVYETKNGWARTDLGWISTEYIVEDGPDGPII